MGLKQQVKTLMFGPPGPRPRRIKRGLLQGAMFTIDTGNKSMRLLGMDEAELAGWTRQLTAQAGVGVDVGANDGWYSTYYALQPNIKRVYAFEPDDRLTETFKENVALNGPAVAAKCTLSTKMVGSVDDDRTCRLDTVLASETERFVMKIDVDGGEAEVLRGAERTLRRLDGSILLEVHSPELERDCLELLKGFGYHCRIVDKGWYRAIIPEARVIPHNRWVIARKQA